MKGLLAVSLLVLAACSGTAIVQTARLNVPDGAFAVEGANPRSWNAPLSFGPFRTSAVSEGTTRSWLVDTGVLELAKSDQAYRMVLEGETGRTTIECHTRELVAGRSGVFVQASLGQAPLLVCGLERGEYRSVLALTRSGKGEPSLVGELRQIGGTTYDIRSLHRAVGSVLPTGEPLGFEITRDESALAVVETANRGRVWIDKDAPNREDFAAAAAALLLFREPDAGTVD
ncbi:MAG: hypothetical protein ABI779_21170 [Acidobacteriota bacterium]